MQKEDLTEILRQHPFLFGLSDEHMKTLIGCATNVHFTEGEHLIREGELANRFFLIRTGRVALEIEVSGKGRLRIQTTGPGEVLGWSWLISPYRWHFSGVAVADARAVSLDAECLRKKCDADPTFGFEMLKRLAVVMENRLEATRLQLLDMYDLPADGAAR
jgi:CRP-like cAMP-binding protein